MRNSRTRMKSQIDIERADGSASTCRLYRLVPETRLASSMFCENINCKELIG